MPEFYIILDRKIIKNTGIFMIFSRKFNKILEFYMIFARKMPEFYMIIARTKYFFPIFFFGGGDVPLLPSVSYNVLKSIRQTCIKLTAMVYFETKNALDFGVKMSKFKIPVEL